MTTMVRIPIPKAGKEGFVECDVDAIPPEMFSIVVMEGLKAVANARMTSKAGPGAVTKLEGEDLKKAHACAMKIAQENITNLLAGDLKPKGTKAAKSDLTREVATEARRLAKELVKDVIRNAGGKPSRVAAKDITAAANAMLEGPSGPEIIAKARENLDSRANLGGANIPTSKEAAQAKLSEMGVAEDPKKVEKARKDAEARKTQLSAKQAGFPKAGTIPTRKRPADVHTTH